MPVQFHSLRDQPVHKWSDDLFVARPCVPPSVMPSLVASDEKRSSTSASDDSVHMRAEVQLTISSLRIIRILGRSERCPGAACGGGCPSLPWPIGRAAAVFACAPQLANSSGTAWEAALMRVANQRAESFRCLVPPLPVPTPSTYTIPKRLS
jgi:hypothetical protein